MRIALVANSYPPNARGGAGQIAFLQAEWLKSHGHEVHIFVPEPFPMEAGDSSITVFKPQTTTPYADLPKRNFLSRLIFHFEDLSPNIALIESVRTFHPDVIITHNLTGCGWGTPKVLSQSGIRWIHILHDVQMFEPSGQILFAESFASLRRLWRSFWAKQRSKALGSPHTVISPSTWLLQYHQSFNLFSNSIAVVIPNPIQIANREPRAPTEALAKEGTTNHEPRISDISGTKTVLYVGRVSKDKGAEVLIQAWQLLQHNPDTSNFESRISNFETQYTKRNTSPEANAPKEQKYEFRLPTEALAKEGNTNLNVHLVIIGSGSYLETIKKLNDPSIECLGAMDHDKLADYYSSASLFVFPSLLLENQPTVLLEAMSAGANIVASDIGGAGELLQGYGTLVPAGDSEKLAQAIKDQLQKNPDLALADSILSQHDIDSVMERLLKSLSE